MFYNTNFSLWYMAAFWFAVTIVYGASLHISLKLAHIEMERAEELTIILLSALVALIPAFGPPLAAILAIYLIYRIADSSLTMVVTVGVVTEAIAILLARGLLSSGIFK